MKFTSCLLLALSVLSVAACSGAPRPPESNIPPDPILTAAAFDRFQSLCIANMGTPQTAVAEANRVPQKVGNGELSEEASLSSKGLVVCGVTFQPGNSAEALTLARSRSASWFRPQEIVSCKDLPNGLLCHGLIDGLAIRSAGLRIDADGKLRLIYLKVLPD